MNDIAMGPLPKEQIDLIRRTVANGATADELALFLYDCQRRGIHPLDKLLHFTKRGGRYTPVTSIDFMRAQAAASGEMAGSDEPIFLPGETSAILASATVTVYRLTQGQRFAYTATARWSEYCPDNAPMWKRMPHTMLSKCAEALALRKAFPQQLAGLYAREEMDQADEPKGGYVVEAPQQVTGPPTLTVVAPSGDTSAPNVGDSGTLLDVPDGAVLIASMAKQSTKNPNINRYVIVTHQGEQVTTIKEQLAALAEACCQEQCPVYLETKASKWGTDVTAIRRVKEHHAALDAEIAAHEGVF